MKNIKKPDPQVQLVQLRTRMKKNLFILVENNVRWDWSIEPLLTVKTLSTFPNCTNLWFVPISFDRNKLAEKKLHLSLD